MNQAVRANAQRLEITLPAASARAAASVTRPFGNRWQGKHRPGPMADMLRAVGVPGNAGMNHLRLAGKAGDGVANARLLEVLASEAVQAGVPLELPAERIQCHSVDWTGLSGLEVVGAGAGRTVLVNDHGSEPPINLSGVIAGGRFGYADGMSSSEPGADDTDRRALVVPAQVPRPEIGDVWYHWHFGWHTGRSARHRYEVQHLSDRHGPVVHLNRPVPARYTDVPGQDQPNAWKWTRGKSVRGAVGPGAWVVELYHPNAETFQSGSRVMLTDGPGINELYGEYLTVDRTELHGDRMRVYFTSPVRMEYAAGLTALIPGPFTEDVCLWDFSVGNANYPRQAYMYARGCPVLYMCGIRFGRFGSPQPSGGVVSVVASGDVTFASLDIDGTLVLNCVAGATIHNLTASTRPNPGVWGGGHLPGGFGGEEYCVDVVGSDMRVGSLVWGTQPGHNHTYANVHVNGSPAGIYLPPGSRINGLSITNSPPGSAMYLNEDDLTITAASADRNLAVFVRGRNVFLQGDFAYVQFDDMPWGGPPSSGRAILSDRTVYTKRTSGRWDVIGGEARP